MTAHSSARSASVLAEAALLTARLSAAERQTLFAALNDAEEVSGALRYLRQTPALLSTGLDLQAFYQNMSKRWQTSADVARDICALYSLPASDTGFGLPPSSSERQSSAVQDPVPQASATPDTWVKDQDLPTPATQPPAVSPRHDGDQFSPGEIPPESSRHDGNQLTDDVPAISHAQLNALRVGVTTLQACALAENLEPSEIRLHISTLTQGLETPGDTKTNDEAVSAEERKILEHQVLIGDAWDFLQTLSDEQLLNVMTMDPENDDASLSALAAQVKGLNALNNLLQIRTIGGDMAAELNRLRGPGFKWTLPALQKEIESQGYEGPDISDLKVMDTLNLGQAVNLLSHLRGVHGAHRPGRKVETVATVPGAPPKASLSKRKERIEYVETLLARSSGVVYTNELSEPFGVNGTSVSSLLREYGYEAIGSGGYRKKRQK